MGWVELSATSVGVYKCLVGIQHRLVCYKYILTHWNQDWGWA